MPEVVGPKQAWLVTTLARGVDDQGAHERRMALRCCTMWSTRASSILPRSTTAEPDVHIPSFEHIPDHRARAAATLACMQFDAAHAILLANQEMYGVVSLNPAIVIALAQIIATNQASTNSLVDGDPGAR